MLPFHRTRAAGASFQNVMEFKVFGFTMRRKSKGPRIMKPSSFISFSTTWNSRGNGWTVRS